MSLSPTGEPLAHRDPSAEVIKIEHPVRGDDTRAWGPPYTPYNAESSQKGPGESAYFLGVSTSTTFSSMPS
jgi:crotonobetainyl-CoA:carnitine CoA-transferase CaiB-like acyl-CoA transferase